MKSIHFIAYNGIIVSECYFSKCQLLKDYTFCPATGEEIVTINEGEDGFNELSESAI